MPVVDGVLLDNNHIQTISSSRLREGQLLDGRNGATAGKEENDGDGKDGKSLIAPAEPEAQAYACGGWCFIR